MTEAEWLAAADPYDLARHPKCRGERKRRLLACACCRRVLRLLPDGRFGQVLEVCERYADGEVGWAEVLAAKKVYRAARRRLGSGEPSDRQVDAAEAVGAAAEKGFVRFKMAMEYAAFAAAAKVRGSGQAREERAQAALGRDIFGNPFRPVALDKSWLTPTVTALAKGMYGSRDFSAMPVLADALQDAGCDNEDILNHCRSDAVHVRGCWVVDLLLGKE